MRLTAGYLLLAVVATALAGGCFRSSDSGGSGGPASKLVRIEPGPEAQQQTLKALLEARPGTVIEFGSGNFDLATTLSLQTTKVTLRGAGADRTALRFNNSGLARGGEGLLVWADHFTLQDLAIEDAGRSMVKIHDAQRVTIQRVRAQWTGGANRNNGAFGISAVLCKDVLIEDCQVFGASDAAVHVGQSQNVIVRRNHVELNAAGIAIENSTGVDVQENQVTNNAIGVLVVGLPGRAKKTGSHCRVFDNQLTANNHPVLSAGTIAAIAPSGSGVVIVANDYVEVFGNHFENNQTMNLGIFSYLSMQPPHDDADFDPYCEAIHVHDNTFVGGGTRPAGSMGVLLSTLLKGDLPDIVFDGIVDARKKVNGQLPSELNLCIRNNGNADFVNLDLANLDLTNPFSPRTGNVTRDLVPYDGRQLPLTSISISPAGDVFDVSPPPTP